MFFLRIMVGRVILTPFFSGPLKVLTSEWPLLTASVKQLPYKTHTHKLQLCFSIFPPLALSDIAVFFIISFFPWKPHESRDLHSLFTAVSPKPSGACSAIAFLKRYLRNQ